jgi:hypothetical protein
MLAARLMSPGHGPGAGPRLTRQAAVRLGPPPPQSKQRGGAAAAAKTKTVAEAEAEAEAETRIAVAGCLHTVVALKFSPGQMWAAGTTRNPALLSEAWPRCNHSRSGQPAKSQDVAAGEENGSMETTLPHSLRPTHNASEDQLGRRGNSRSGRQVGNPGLSSPRGRPRAHGAWT